VLSPWHIPVHDNDNRRLIVRVELLMLDPHGDTPDRIDTAATIEFHGLEPARAFFGKAKAAIADRLA
jgi:hypothetical protein